MGNWQLEAAKMVAYIAFPVTMFHWFNQPENFSKFVRDVKLTCLPVYSKDSAEQLDAFIYKFNKEKEAAAIDMMEMKLSK